MATKPTEVDSMNRLRVQAETKAKLYRRALELACDGDGDKVAYFVSEAGTAIAEERYADGVSPSSAQSFVHETPNNTDVGGKDGE